jgi:glycerol-3-phosphate O-acyltransferase
VLLHTRGAALTLEQLHHALQDPLEYLERRRLPMTASAAELRTPGGRPRGG